MLKVIKRGVSRVKRKPHLAFGSRNCGASAAHRSAGDPNTHGAPGPSPSPISTSADYMPSIAASLQPEARNTTLHPDPASIVPAPTRAGTHTGQMIRQPLQGHTYSVWSVAYSPDGARIISGSSDKTIRIWDAHPSKRLDSHSRGTTLSSTRLLAGL